MPSTANGVVKKTNHISGDVILGTITMTSGFDGASGGGLYVRKAGPGYADILNVTVQLVKDMNNGETIVATAKLTAADWGASEISKIIFEFVQGAEADAGSTGSKIKYNLPAGLADYGLRFLLSGHSDGQMSIDGTSFVMSGAANSSGRFEFENLLTEGA